MHNEETHENQSKVQEDSGNPDGRMENNLLPNIESNVKIVTHKPHLGTNSSLRAPIETRGRKSEGIVINDGTTWNNKKAGG